ncbi:MAG: hypothetical protein HOP95_11390 [Sphingomonas sp.]|nr:hypothetical protein [Sphingomonas sp.]
MASIIIRPMKRVLVTFLAAASLAALAFPVVADPPSGSLDPPPGPQDYIAAFPPHRWVFGKLLWQGREPCTSDFCEAAYNAEPLFLLVQKEKNCCGSAGYSITIIGRVKDCPSVSYYLVFSKDLYKLTKS